MSPNQGLGILMDGPHLELRSQSLAMMLLGFIQGMFVLLCGNN